MDSNRRLHPPTLHWVEWLVVIALVLVCLVLGVKGLGRKNKNAYQVFGETAPQIQAALERFAADHQGCFPPDAAPNRPPRGFTDEYIPWRPEWKIDYEAKDNGSGGAFVCLEFGGPYRRQQYLKLCEDPEIRRRYGRGQPIPNQRNRIWVVRENAPIMFRDCR